jgi:hypothetical protein
MAKTEFAQPVKDYNVSQLAEEIAALNLPNYVGIETHSERRGTPPAGAVTPPYVVVNSDALTNAQKTAVTNAIASHSAATVTDSRKTAYTAASTNLAKIDLLAEALGFKDA